MHAWLSDDPPWPYATVPPHRRCRGNGHMSLSLLPPPLPNQHCACVSFGTTTRIEKKNLLVCCWSFHRPNTKTPKGRRNCIVRPENKETQPNFPNLSTDGPMTPSDRPMTIHSWAPTPISDKHTLRRTSSRAVPPLGNHQQLTFCAMVVSEIGTGPARTTRSDAAAKLTRRQNDHRKAAASSFLSAHNFYPSQLDIRDNDQHHKPKQQSSQNRRQAGSGGSRRQYKAVPVTTSLSSS